MDTLNTWFHLKGERESFRPDPMTDRDVMFCHQDVEKGIRKAVQKAFATGDTIKLLLWGDWGVGKTHALHHLDYWLEMHAGDFPTSTVYVEIGDIDKDDKFAKVHKDLMDGVGLDRLIRLAHGYMEKRGSLQVGLERIGIPSGMAQVFMKLFVAAPGQTPPEAVLTAWQYLRGEDVGKTGTALGLPRQLIDGKEFYYVLAALGHMVRIVEGRQLLFLVDEASKLEAVSAVQATQRHWVNVNKLIFDQANVHFGFIYTVSGKGQDDLPPALFEPQIENRLGNRRIELRNLEPADVRKFLANLTAGFLDLDAGEAALAAAGTPVTKATYPFTAPAFDRFVEFFQRSQENSKPRNITDSIDDLAFAAMDRGSLLIEDADLNELNM